MTPGAGISHNGRWIAFSSHAYNLIPNDTTCRYRVDRQIWFGHVRLADMDAGNVVPTGSRSHRQESRSGPRPPSTRGSDLRRRGLHTKDLRSSSGVHRRRDSRILRPPRLRPRVESRRSHRILHVGLEEVGRARRRLHPRSGYGRNRTRSTDQRLQKLSFAERYGPRDDLHDEQEESRACRRYRSLGRALLRARDRGPNLGVGGFERPDVPKPPDDRICVQGFCIPPAPSVAFLDRSGDVDQGPFRAADLIGGYLTPRPPLGDLYLTLDLATMPRTPTLAAATSGIVYGVSLVVDGERYEIRAASTGLGPNGETTADFGLFSCSGDVLGCTKVKDLDGGFGTTGERITFSVPAEDVGMGNDSIVSRSRAFAATGSFLGGALQTLDEAKPSR